MINICIHDKFMKNIYIFFKPLDIVIYLFIVLDLLCFLTANNTCKYLLIKYKYKYIFS